MHVRLLSNPPINSCLTVYSQTSIIRNSWISSSSSSQAELTLPDRAFIRFSITRFAVGFLGVNEANDSHSGYVQSDPSTASIWSVEVSLSFCAFTSRTCLTHRDLSSTIKNTSTSTPKLYVNVDIKLAIIQSLLNVPVLLLQVLTRCYKTLIPTEDYVSVVLNSNPDLYGPFWTLTTVIFSLFVFSSLASSISSYLSSEPWDYDFKSLGTATGIVYAYGLGVPVALWAALRYLGVGDGSGEWGLLNAISLFGYGMTVWMYVLCTRSLSISISMHAESLDDALSYQLNRPVSLICIAPIPLLRWVAVGLASGLSGFFLIRNIYPVLALVSFSSLVPLSRLIDKLTQYSSQAEAKATRLLIVIIAILHLAVALSFKILFFKYYIKGKEVGPKDPVGGGGTDNPI